MLGRFLKTEAESAALVAAAYEHIVAVLTDAEYGSDVIRRVQLATPADATAALEAYGAAKVREGWEAGMKEAMDIKAFMPGSGKMKPMMKPWQDAILAAIKEKQP